MYQYSKFGKIWRKLLLKLIFGNRTFDYIKRSVCFKNYVVNCHYIDINIRKDGTDNIVEADWIKNIYRIIK